MLLTLVLALFAIGGAVDLVLDRPDRLLSAHVLFEVALLALALGTTFYLWSGWSRAGQTLVRAEAELATRARERDQWRARAERLLRGLGEEIDTQLRAWGLTPAERETALLLLKGYGFKEIASLQGKSERTVRQHAIAVYRKSGLGGRAELSAFFLEDLLLPSEAAAPDEEAVEPG